MEKNTIQLTPHPLLLEALFAFKSKVFKIFNDVLGLYDIHHIAINRISFEKELLIFSSNPAMEFNLFNTNLWHFDKSYHYSWIKNCSQSEWFSLYDPERLDDLYYLKQIKHHLTVGYALSAKVANTHFVYSIGSRYKDTQTNLISKIEDFYKIGQYCSSLLEPFFNHYDALSSQFFSKAHL